MGMASHKSDVVLLWPSPDTNFNYKHTPKIHYTVCVGFQMDFI